MTQTILDANKLIAEFMGIETKVYSDAPTITLWNFNNFMLKEHEMKYESDWNWIMPVIEKIDSLGYDSTIFSQDDYNKEEYGDLGDLVFVYRWYKPHTGFLACSAISGDRKSLYYKAAIAFINYHNSKK